MLDPLVSLVPLGQRYEFLWLCCKIKSIFSYVTPVKDGLTALCGRGGCQVRNTFAFLLSSFCRVL